MSHFTSPEGHRVHLDQIDRMSLIQMNLPYAVVIAKDVSVRSVGAVEAAYYQESDAKGHCEYLCACYTMLGADAFVVVDIRKLS